MKFKTDSLNLFQFTLLFFQALFKRRLSNKLKVIIVIFTSYFLSSYIVLYWTQFNEMLWVNGSRNPKKKPRISNAYTEQWFSNANTERWLLSSEKPRAVGNMHVFMTCQIYFVDKQLASSLCWKNPLSEALLSEPYILTV